MNTTLTTTDRSACEERGKLIAEAVRLWHLLDAQTAACVELQARNVPEGICRINWQDTNEALHNAVQSLSDATGEEFWDTYNLISSYVQGSIAARESAHERLCANL